MRSSTPAPLGIALGARALRVRAEGRWDSSASTTTSTTTPTPAPTLDATLAVRAFRNAGFDSSESCLASAATGLLASAGWSVWATVLDYGNVLYHLDGGPGLNATGFSSSFAGLAPGNHSLTLAETVSGRTVSSQLWSFAIVAPPAPTATLDPFAAECAQAQSAHLEATAIGAAQIYVEFLRGRINFYCR